MSEQDDNMKKQPENEAALEDFLEPDNYADDKIIVEKKPQKTITIFKPDNNSGMGEAAPYAIAKKFNWGAFLFNWVWGIKYKRWALMLIPFFCFIKYGFLLSLVLAFYAGTKGNQWAWEEVQYKDEIDFHNAQKSWVKAWFVFAAICLMIAAPAFYLYSKNHKTEEGKILDPISEFSSLELNIPNEIYEQTTTDDNHADVLTSDKYVIYWVRPKNSGSEKNLADIERMYNTSKVAKENFILYPDLKALSDETASIVDIDLKASCINDTCVDTWLYKACNSGYCIINPQARKYYKVRGKSKVIPKALQVLKKWQ